MIINITHKTTIEHIQIKLSVAYSFLKIEFCDKAHKQGQKIMKAHWYDASFKLLEIAKKQQAGWITLHPWYKTGFVEEIFENRFGLHAQIFRKENDQWIETAGTDVFTLEDQNEIGRKMVDKNRGVYRRERELLL